MIEAERAHTGIGIWDIYCDGDIELMKKILIESSKSYLDSIYYHKNFSIIYDLENNALPVSCCCQFKYPDCSLSKTLESFSEIIQKLFNLDPEYYKNRLDFLDDAFPTNVKVLKAI